MNREMTESPLSLQGRILAVETAMGFLESAMLIEAVCKRSSKGEMDSKLEGMKIASQTNMHYALEIMLKILLDAGGQRGHGHNLQQLWDGCSKECRKQLEVRWETGPYPDVVLIAMKNLPSPKWEGPMPENRPLATFRNWLEFLDEDATLRGLQKYAYEDVSAMRFYISDLSRMFRTIGDTLKSMRAELEQMNKRQLQGWSGVSE